MSNDTNESTQAPLLIPDGLHAFPNAVVVPDGKGGAFYAVAHGMTLRDWFAGQALAGLMAHPHAGENLSNAEASEVAYELADAMLKAREGGK